MRGLQFLYDIRSVEFVDTLVLCGGMAAARTRKRGFLEMCIVE